jgi:DNA-binding NtrC family response regulator
MPPRRAQPRDDSTAAIVRDRPPPLAVVVRVHGAQSNPVELRLGAGRTVIGAGSDVDLIVDHATVSRRHVELELVPEGVAVVDLGSRNGTFFLGQRVERAVLAPGSRVRIGSVDVSIDLDASGLDREPGESQGYRGLVGASVAMRKLFSSLARLEGSLVNVLVEGESGVGKELVARALHEGSAVAAGPFVAVNCAALGRELVVSELFGHRRGAFTSAVEDRRGAFEAASGGTLFLDEIGELPLEVQPVLLRALESGEVKPIGETAARLVKVRLVCATNRDLREGIAAGTFREDLFYRVAVVSLRVPPLRARLEDVPLLARKLAAEAGAGTLPDEVLAQLERYAWPGNVRELRNAVQSYLALGTLPETLSEARDLLASALRRTVDLERSYQDQKDHVVELFSRVYFEALLARTGGNQSEAARLSGIERSYLSKLLDKFGVAKR